MQTATTMSSTADQYEFAAAHDARLAKTSAWARQLGLVNFIAAIFAVANGVYPTAAVQVMFGVLLLYAGRSLRAVVTTSGRDVAHLLTAARHVKTVLWLRSAALMLGLLAFVVVIALRAVQH